MRSEPSQLYGHRYADLISGSAGFNVLFTAVGNRLKPEYPSSHFSLHHSIDEIVCKLKRRLLRIANSSSLNTFETVNILSPRTDRRMNSRTFIQSKICLFTQPQPSCSELWSEFTVHVISSLCSLPHRFPTGVESVRSEIGDYSFFQTNERMKEKVML